MKYKTMHGIAIAGLALVLLVVPSNDSVSNFLLAAGLTLPFSLLAIWGDYKYRKSGKKVPIVWWGPSVFGIHPHVTTFIIVFINAFFVFAAFWQILR